MKKALIWIVVLAVVGVAGFMFFKKKDSATGEVEYRYATVEKGEIVQSISASGQLVALTAVDVKSKAGGRVKELRVDEGSYVHKGDVIAVIDPADTKAVYDQTAADLTAAEARALQASENYKLQVASNKNEIADARAALNSARIRLQRVELETKRTPELTNSTLSTAQANYEEAISNKHKLEQVTIPSRRREVDGDFARTKAELDAAKADYERQQRLLGLGYVAKSKVEAAQSSLQSAQAAFNLAEQARMTVEQDITVQIRSADASVERAAATLRTANANRADMPIADTNLAEAKQAVKTAQIALDKAITNSIQNSVRRSDISAAQASTVRSRVSMNNAELQLKDTTVVAPRDGVVTLKYLEEGTIIPAGTSTFAQGPAIVQLSDVTTLYVECMVDEADVAAVKPGQKVRVTTEAYKGRGLEGTVTRVNPSAKTEQNVTSVKVRVKVLPPKDKAIRLLPGMNATCEFITLSKPDVIVVPTQAVEDDNGTSCVRVKSPTSKVPVRRDVKVGATGNDGIEILDGLKVGDEVVTAEINLAEAKEIQQKMVEAQQGGGLVGGGNRGGRSFGATNTKGGAGKAGGGTGGGAGKAGGGGKMK